MMAKVFISFIHEEHGYAEAVQSFITQMVTEVVPFLSSDKFQVYAGEKWLDRIMEELEGAEVVILMLSEKSVSRPWVNFEAGAAWTRQIVTIPVCYGKLSKENLPKPYSSLQAIDLNDLEDHEYLVRSVAHHLKVEKPGGRFRLPGLAALGGPESMAKEKRELYAYERFDECLKLLKDESL